MQSLVEVVKFFYAKTFILPKLKRIEARGPTFPSPFCDSKEALGCMLKRAVEGGFLTPCQLRRRDNERVYVSHLLFADDTLIFCKASKDEMTHLCWLLMWFEVISGLMINLKKANYSWWDWGMTRNSWLLRLGIR